MVNVCAQRDHLPFFGVNGSGGGGGEATTAAPTKVNLASHAHGIDAQSEQLE